MMTKQRLVLVGGSEMEGALGKEGREKEDGINTRES